ncbi:hypothetical protein O181_056992 [Austropuccinia psidii MF-1]|uniref:Integrase catalytic domain-containing protein n=1 Tax=Austropuccinia psidii MF-1 TaxID=1389203 RepID=A0A9Q3EGW2_9BASI|nr:hypothetical protein [Austropuccinia psidii MF-1]
MLYQKNAMKVPSQGTYQRTAEGRKSRPEYCGQCGRDNVTEYCKTCDRCQKEDESTGKRLGNMRRIQEPSRPWEHFELDWGTGLPPGGYKSYDSFTGIVNRFRKTPIFFSCHKDDTAMDTALLILNRVVSWTGIFTNIISKRYLKSTSELWKNLQHIYGTKLSFSIAYHAQADGLAERMIQSWKKW